MYKPKYAKYIAQTVQHNEETYSIDSLLASVAPVLSAWSEQNHIENFRIPAMILSSGGRCRASFFLNTIWWSPQSLWYGFKNGWVEYPTCAWVVKLISQSPAQKRKGCVKFPELNGLEAFRWLLVHEFSHTLDKRGGHGPSFQAKFKEVAQQISVEFMLPYLYPAI